MAGSTNPDAVNVQWSSKFAFIMAAIGSAVGLGNLWRFPYVAGENGGGAFVLFYLICVILIGLPVLTAELMIGRRGRMSAVGSVVSIAKAEGKSPWWALQSWFGMIGAFVILTFYSVIAGWVLAYVVMLAGDLFASLGTDGLSAGAFASTASKAMAEAAAAGLSQAEIDAAGKAAISGQLGALLDDPTRMIIYHAIFISITVFIVARGVKGGIEQAVTILMPAFFVMLLALVGYSVIAGDAGRGFDFLFGFRVNDVPQPDGSEWGGFMKGLKDGSLVSAALGQAFFSIGLGSALMATYGAYMSRDQNLPKSARLIAISDTAVGILAGIAIFPIVFHMMLNPAGGPTLMFQTLPLAFQGMPYGAIFGLAFFVLAFFAAITSSIALLEASTAWFEEQAPGKQRTGIAIILGLVVFVIGIFHALSQVDGNIINQWRPWGGIALFQDSNGNPMELLSFSSALTDIILPLAGFITALFAGWAVSSTVTREAIGFESEFWFKAWHFLIRWVCPLAIGGVLFYGAVYAPFFMDK